MKEIDEIRIENLIYRLNHLADQRKELLDKLWVLENETEQMRLDLLKLINGRQKC